MCVCVSVSKGGLLEEALVAIKTTCVARDIIAAFSIFSVIVAFTFAEARRKRLVCVCSYRTQKASIRVIHGH